jgi:hypothetical protein
MTRDHSLVNDYLLAMPELTEEQRSELPKNVITRALGMQEHVAVDLQSDDALPGDLYILCSDGLSGMIEDAEIQRLVTETNDLDDACRRLVALANEHGGEDNITAVVVRIEDFDGESDTPVPDSVARAATEAPPPGSAVVPATAPIPTIRMRTPSFTDEPTAPAIDLHEVQAKKAEEIAKQIGEDPTLPAVDLSKELAALKKKDP